MNWSWLFLILFVFIPAQVSAIEITEIMYNPPGNDNNREFVEIFSDSYINLSGFIIFDADSNDTLELLFFFPSNYSLIVEEGFNYDNNTINASIYSAGKTIGNNLNDEDIIYLYYPNGTLIDSVSYTSELGAKGNNRTLEKNKEGEWKESIVDGGTPGRKNSIYDYDFDYSNLIINEIMSDPFNDDDALRPLGEWIELYNTGKNNILLDGLVFYDSEDDNELYITNTNTNLIELCSGCYATIYRNGDSDFDLSKANDKIRLYTGYPIEENTLIDEMSYTNAVEGMSFSKFDDGWYLARPTPNEENIYTENCDWQLSIETDSSIFKKDDLNFKIIVKRNIGFESNISVKGEIKDYNGEIIKRYSPWNNTLIKTSNSKKYSPNLKEGIYQITFNVENITCRDFDEENDKITKLVAINPKFEKTENLIQIEKIYLGSDKKAEWADQFTAKVIIYKGNDTKTSIQAWVEKDSQIVSKRSKLNIYEKFQHYTLTLPIQLHPNCAYETGEDGTATLIVEGLNQRATQEFKVEGIDPEVCKEYASYIKKKEKELTEEKKANANQIIDLPAEVHPGKVLRVKIQLWDDVPHDYKAWSYLYRGNKCYSCNSNQVERDSNKVELKLKENELKIIELLVKIDKELDEGEYSLMVKLNKDNQKTNKHLTQKIYVKKLSESNITTPNNNTIDLFLEKEKSNNTIRTNNADKEKILNQLTGITVYESNSEKAKKLIPSILFVTFALLSLMLIITRNKN